MTIQEILTAHDDLYFNNQNNKFYCDCGLELGAKRKAYYVMDSTHRAHVAEVLDKHMQEREYRAWSNGFHKGRKTENGSHISTWPKNPYRKDTSNGR